MAMPIKQDTAPHLLHDLLLPSPNIHLRPPLRKIDAHSLEIIQDARLLEIVQDAHLLEIVQEAHLLEIVQDAHLLEIVQDAHHPETA